MNRKTRLAFTLVMTPFAWALGACSAPGSDTVRKMSVREHWNQTVAMEDVAEGYFAMTVQRTNEGFMAIRNKYPLAEQCFVDSERVLTNAVSGRYDTSATDADTTNNRPTGEVNGVMIGKALVVNEAYPGDIEICQKMKDDIADDITVWRAQRANDFAQLWDAKVDLDIQYQGDLFRSLAVDLLNYAKEQAEKLGVPVPEYVYPTFHLEVVSKDKDICDYYGVDWNGGLNQCTLRAKAAREYMFRPFVSAAVQDSFDSGVDDLNPLDDGDK
jgi:hypothetical protein